VGAFLSGFLLLKFCNLSGRICDHQLFYSVDTMALAWWTYRITNIDRFARSTRGRAVLNTVQIGKAVQRCRKKSLAGPTFVTAAARMQHNSYL